MTHVHSSKDLEFAAELADVIERHVRPRFREDRQARMAIALVWADPEDADAFQLILSRAMTDALLDRVIAVSRGYGPTAITPKPGQ